MKIRWQESIGFFGGTFDPPHLGHLTAMVGALEKPGLQKILVSPTPNPPQKALLATYEVRRKWVEALIALAPSQSKDRLVLDETENDIAKKGPSFSFDILTQLSSRYPALFFIMGTDQFLNLQSWHRFPEVLDCCHWLVLQRKGVTDSALKAQLSSFERSGLLRSGRNAVELSPHAPGELTRYTTPRNKLFLLCETDAPEISSTELRRELETCPKREDLSPQAQKALPEAIDLLYRQYLRSRSRTA